MNCLYEFDVEREEAIGTMLNDKVAPNLHLLLLGEEGMTFGLEASTAPRFVTTYCFLHKHVFRLVGWVYLF